MTLKRPAAGENFGILQLKTRNPNSKTMLFAPKQVKNRACGAVKEYLASLKTLSHSKVIMYLINAAEGGEIFWHGYI